MPEDQRYEALDFTLRSTLARCWGAHKESLGGWKEFCKLKRLRFGHADMKITEKYDGQKYPHENLSRWTTTWGTKPQLEWVHMFFHSLDMIPQQWYLEIELCHGTTDWDEMIEALLLTYSFPNG